jgi:predicted  nucleic acid-binding Zn-ribbon protein
VADGRAGCARDGRARDRVGDDGRSGGAPAQRAAAASAPPTAQPHIGTIRLGSADQAFAFALVLAQDGSSIMSGNDKDLREVMRRRAQLHGDFLWVRQGKQRYVVTDPAALAEVQALWAPVHALDAEMDELGDRIDAQAEIVERVSREGQAAHDAPSAELQALHKRMAVLQKQRDKAQAEIDKLARKAASTRDEKPLAQLEQQQERLEKALEPLDESIDALSQQMDRVSDAREQAVNPVLAQQEQDAERAMEALSAQMEALSQQQEAAAKAAEQQLRALIQNWLARGVAKPG